MNLFILTKCGCPIWRQYYNPTLLFISPDGFVTARRQGFTAADSLLDFASKAQAAGFKSDEQAFLEGRRDAQFLKRYIKNLCDDHQADAVEQALNTLHSEQGGKLLSDPDYWKAFVSCVADRHSALCKDFISNYKSLCSVHGNYEVDQKVRNLYASFPVVLSLYDGDPWSGSLNDSRKQQLFSSIDSLQIPTRDELKQEVDYLILLKQHDYAGALKWGNRCLKDASPRVLRNWAAWGERMVRNDQATRTSMAAWADKASQAADANEIVKEESSVIAHDLRSQASPVSTYPT
jgi:hypothetical protein